MRKLVLIGLLLSIGAGCGRSWSPFNRGSSCKGSCFGGAPALPAASGCNDCVGSTAAGYGSYEGAELGGEVISSYDGGYSSPVVTSGVYGSGVPSGAITNPSMSNLPAP